MKWTAIAFALSGHTFDRFARFGMNADAHLLAGVCAFTAVENEEKKEGFFVPWEKVVSVLVLIFSRYF